MFTLNMDTAERELEVARAEQQAERNKGVMPPGVYSAYVNTIKQHISDKRDKGTGEVVGKSVGFKWTFTILSMLETNEGLDPGELENAEMHAGTEVGNYTYVGFIPNGKTTIESMANAFSTINAFQAIQIERAEDGTALITPESYGRKLVNLQIVHRTVPSTVEGAEDAIYPEVKKIIPHAQAGERYQGTVGQKSEIDNPF